jgi:hypothetical protein
MGEITTILEATAYKIPFTGLEKRKRQHGTYALLVRIASLPQSGSYFLTRCCQHRSDWDGGGDKWDQIVEDAQTIIDRSKISVESTIKSTYILINDKDERGETFSVQKKPTKFDCCKTNYSDYDVVVTAILLRIHMLGCNIKISSDGDWDEWTGARKLIKRIWGEEPSKPESFNAEDEGEE